MSSPIGNQKTKAGDMASSHRGVLDLSFKEAGGDKDDYSNSVASDDFPTAPSEPGSKSLKPSMEVVGDEDTDDDCIILDGDPNKPLALVVNECEDDDLKIVGEKGKIACRDFPHPRYLCATFPFASTPHELHCGQCYCYVCDSPAPCTYWDTTISSTDHCQATHKEEHWRTERRLLKEGDLPVPVIPSMGDGTYLIQALRTPEFPTLDLQPPKPLTTEMINTSNVSLLNAVNQGRPLTTSGFPLQIYNPRSHLLSPQSYPAFNNTSNIASRGGNVLRTLRCQSILNRVSFKRSVVGPSLNHRQGYGTQLCTYSSLKWCHTRLISAVSHGSDQPNIGSRPLVPTPSAVTSLQPNIGSRPLVPAPSAVTSLQPNFSSPLITYPIHFQSQLAAPSQPCPNASFVNDGPSPSHVASWPSPNGISSSSISSSSIAFRNDHLLLPSMGVRSPHLNMVNGFGSRSFQSPEHDNTAALLMGGQNRFEQGNHCQIGARVSSLGFGGSAWDSSSISHGNPADFMLRLPNQQPQ